ncbi:hypothetical protein B6U91_01150 [Candidatus Pacearchaeota archaeon ex4484_71]|nr:MAG: hypothetical protein B6U91_01150 [Candidatus Pacearchaeota archaeon ex4484_71]
MAEKGDVVEKEIITRRVIRTEPSKKKKTAKKKTATKKKTTKRKTTRKVTRRTTKPKTDESQRILIENFASLQKVMTHLSENFNNLSNRINTLLNIFENAAKEIAKKDLGIEKERQLEKSILTKLDELLDQNKIIAKSMTLFYEQPKEKEEEKITERERLDVPRPSPKPRPLETEIKSPTKRQEELGTKNPFVVEEEKEEWPPEFEMP